MLLCLQIMVFLEVILKEYKCKKKFCHLVISLLMHKYFYKTNSFIKLSLLSKRIFTTSKLTICWTNHKKLFFVKYNYLITLCFYQTIDFKSFVLNLYRFLKDYKELLLIFLLLNFKPNNIVKRFTFISFHTKSQNTEQTVIYTFV